MKIFVFSPNLETFLSEQHITSLQKAGDLILHKEVSPFDKIPGLFEGSEERLVAIDPDFCDWQFPNYVIAKIPRLTAIVLQTTSFSWLDTEFAKQRGIPVVNLRGFSSTAVAEWATMMMFALARKLPLVIKDNWQQDYRQHQGLELRGKKVGIIGLGNIGKTIAENCIGLGMSVQYWSRASRDKRFQYVELAELMQSSDVIFPVVAQNQDTQGMITDELLRKMRPAAIFISVIHNVYNHQLLIDMVQTGQLYGYGFEDPKARMTNFTGNIWAGPELAWCTSESLMKNATQWVTAITKATKGEYPTRVN